MTSFSLRYAHGNVLLGRGGDSAALYRLAMSAYPYLPTGGKWALQRRLQRLAHTIAADFSLWRVSRAYPAEQYVAHNAGLLDGRHQDPAAWQAFLEGHEAAAARTRLPHSRVLPRRFARRKASRAASAQGSSEASTECAADRGGRPGSARPLRSRRASSQNCRHESSAPSSDSAASSPPDERGPSELQWLLRRAVCRGIGEPVLDRHFVARCADRLRHPAAASLSSRSGSDLRQCAQAAITERAVLADHRHRARPLPPGAALPRRARRSTRVPGLDRRGAVRAT